MFASKEDQSGLQDLTGLTSLNGASLKTWPGTSRHWLSSLRVQILLWTIFPVVLILIVISFTSIYTHQQSMRSLVAQRDGELARIAAARLSDSLISRGGAVSDLATLAQSGLVTLPSEEQPGRRRTIYLVDQAGRVVYHPDPQQVGRELGQHAGITEVRQGKSGAAFHDEANGEELVIGYAPVTPTGWGLIVQEPWADVIAPLMQYSLIAPLTLLVAALLSLLAIYFGVRRISSCSASRRTAWPGAISRQPRNRWVGCVRSRTCGAA